jgi:hypothetical protein
VVTVISGAATRGGRDVELDVDVGLEGDMEPAEEGFLVVFNRDVDAGWELEGFLVVLERDVDTGLELEVEPDEEGFLVVVDRVVGPELSPVFDDEREEDVDMDVDLLV